VGFRRATPGEPAFGFGGAHAGAATDSAAVTGTIIAFWRLSRPTSTLIVGTLVLLGGHVARSGGWHDAIPVAAAAMCLAAAGNAWNDYRDIDIDRVNRPRRPLPAGTISPRAALAFAPSAAVLALALAFSVSGSILGLISVLGLVNWLYSFRLKSTILLGNCAVALSVGCTPLLGGLAAGNPVPSLWLAVVLGFATMAREVLKTIADYDGDLAGRCRTIVTAWGPEAGVRTFCVLAGMALLAMMAPAFLGGYGPLYGIVVAAWVWPLWAYVAVGVVRTRDGRRLTRLGELMKYSSLVWIIATYLSAPR
jgi:geranylgeranylglycerol-phosphate geranylgeranyltransferase